MGMDKKQVRLRWARKTRVRIAEQKTVRLTVHRSNCHIYAQVVAAGGGRTLAAASTLDPELRKEVPNGGNVQAARVVGKLIAERAKKAGIEEVAFDRAGFRYAGRVKALAEAARESGLKF